MCVGSKALPSGTCLNRFTAEESIWAPGTFISSVIFHRDMSFFRRIFFSGEESEKRHVFLVLEACLCLTCWPFSGTVHPYIKECSADKFNVVWLNFLKRGNWGGEKKKRCRACFFSHKHLNFLMFCFVCHWMWLKGNLLFFPPLSVLFPLTV